MLLSEEVDLISVSGTMQGLQFCLLINCKTDTASWMLAEHLKFLGQRQRIVYYS